MLLVLLALAVFVAQPWRGAATGTELQGGAAPKPELAEAAPAPVERKEVAAAEAIDAAAAATLRLRAIDEQGQPVAKFQLQLTLMLRLPDGGGEMAKSSPLPWTGDDGIALAPALQPLVPSRHELVRATVCAPLVGGDGPEVAIDFAAPPTKPIDVPVPAFGQLEAVLLGPDGQPWPVPKGSDDGIWVRGAGVAQSRSTFHAFGPEGRVSIDRVACAAHMIIGASGPWGTRNDVDGPARAGETIRVVFQLPTAAVVLVGRLLDGDRHPYRERALAHLDAYGTSAFQFVAQPDGRFRLALRSDCAGQNDLNFTGCASDALDSNDEAVEVPLRAPLVAGINELGDIVLTKAPLLISGRVVVADGGALPNCSLQLERQQVTPVPNWQEVRPNPLRRLVDGNFSVHALARGLRYRLQVRGACRPQTIEFAPGTADLTVKLTRGCSVTATFLLHDVIERLWIKVVPQFPPLATDPPLNNVERDARFRGRVQRDADRVALSWEGLDAGPYRFVVNCPGFGAVMDIPIALSDGPTVDPRLVDIDLRNVLRAIRVSVTDRDGKRLPTMASIFLRGGPAPDAWAQQAITPDSSSLAIFPASQPVDLYVLARGFRGRVLRGVFDDVCVEMEAAPTVTVRCAQAASLPAGITAALRWSLVEKGLTGGVLGASSMPYELSSGVATMRCETPLPIQVALDLRKARSASETIALLPASIDPAALVDGQTIELIGDDAALQLALQKLSKR